MLFTREQLLEIEEKSLAPYATLSKNSQGRVVPGESDPYRLPFQRDRDRIIHSRSFRRLKDKTQVFISGSGDHFRNRLTHTMEVSQVSRDIARSLGLNEDLSESIALAHDLGHTPFGHAGETALDKLLKDFGFSFEHNEQSKRTVEVLERPYHQLPGLNLTKETIDGLIKHQSPYDNVNKTFRFLPSLEAQVVNLADEIAYTAHDTDDGLRSQIITREELSEIELWQEASELACKSNNTTSAETLSRDRIISKIIGLVIKDLYSSTEEVLKSNNIDSVEKVHNYKGIIVQFSPEMRRKTTQLRQFLYKNLYLSDAVLTAMKHGQKMIGDIFQYYFDYPEKLPENFQFHSEDQKVICIKDYIAGMTDIYAKKEWEELIK